MLVAFTPQHAQCGKFDKYKTCETCVGAGLGWSPQKKKCGGYSTKVCPQAAKRAAAKPAATKPVASAADDAEEHVEVATPNVKSLTTTNFDKHIKAHDVVLVKFYAPWCGHCKRLAPEFEKAAASLAQSDPKISLAKVDTAAQPRLKKAHSIKAFPELVLFRNGQRKMLYEDERTSEALIAFLQEEKDVPAPPPPEPEFLKFDIANSQHLMSHKIKNQVAFFYDAQPSLRKKANKMLKDLKKISEEFAGHIIVLHIAINEPKNKQVLDRFNVKLSDIPCMRVAAIYPDGAGMRIYQPGPNSKGYADKLIVKKKNMRMFVQAHLGKETQMVTRSEKSTPQTSQYVKDLIGDDFEKFIHAPNAEQMIMFHMENCKHCKKLKPHYESTAVKLRAINTKLRPADKPEIQFSRMDGVKNEVEHEQVLAGSYPYLVYFGSDKENPIQVPHMRNEETLWDFIVQNTWIGDLDEDAIASAVEEGKEEL